MEEEKVGGTSVLDKQNIRIYKIRVLVQQVEVSIWSCQVWLLEGSLFESKIGLVFMKVEEFIIMYGGHYNKNHDLFAYICK